MSLLDDSNEIEKYAIQAKALKGLALKALVEQTLSSKRIYAYGELLQVPSVRDLAGTEYNKSLNTLELFAYGTYKDFAQNPENFIELNAAQTVKLRQLTIISMAEKDRIIPYALLEAELGITTLRDLEKIIIDSIYGGLIIARIDQRAQLVRVKDFKARDVQPSSMAAYLSTLESFKDRAKNLVSVFEQASTNIARQRSSDADMMVALQLKVDSVKEVLKTDVESGSFRGMGGMGMGGMGGMGMGGGKGRRSVY